MEPTKSKGRAPGLNLGPACPTFSIQELGEGRENCICVYEPYIRLQTDSPVPALFKGFNSIPRTTWLSIKIKDLALSDGPSVPESY